MGFWKKYRSKLITWFIIIGVVIQINSWGEFNNKADFMWGVFGGSLIITSCIALYYFIRDKIKWKRLKQDK